MKKLNLVTLGCAKNTVDSEHLAARLLAAGYEVVHDGPDDRADIAVVNTCGFIADAKEESIDVILRLAEARKAGRLGRLFVIGCLSERYADELRDEIPEADGFFGVRDMEGVLRALEAESAPCPGTERLLSTPPHYAYLKISEGCDRRCAYCAIPLIRGPHASVPFEQIAEEAERLAAKGVKELLVIAQDTTCYGLDLYGRRRLGELLRRLCRIAGIRWIRLHYAYPAGFPDDVIRAMREEEKICPYLDIPLQHISDRVLRAMNRGIGRDDTLRLIEKLRREVPGIALRTTLLAGFPGETETEFAELEDFVREVRFERLGVFPYCEEEGTPSALRLRDDVPAEVKEERAARIMELQSAVSLEHNRGLVGRRMETILDGREGSLWVGRTRRDSPEVDGTVLIEPSGRLRAGDIREVLITSADEYDLRGRCV